MKKTFNTFFALAFIFFSISLSSCFETRDNISSVENVFDINKANWNNYCLVENYFLGVRNGEIVATCYFKVDSNYKIYEDIKVELKVTYDVFYYTNLLGGDETHSTCTYYFSGVVSDNIEKLIPDHYPIYTGDKEYYSRGNPKVTITRITGKLYR